MASKKKASKNGSKKGTVKPLIPMSKGVSYPTSGDSSRRGNKQWQMSFRLR